MSTKHGEAFYTVDRVGWGGSGHWGQQVLRRTDPDGAPVDSGGGPIGGPSPEEVLGRALPPGTRLRISVEVVEEGVWDDRGRSPQHRDGKAWDYCIDCAKEVFTTGTLDALEVLVQGQAEDLLVDWRKGDRAYTSVREVALWRSRCGVADGEPFENKVTLMHRREGWLGQRVVAEWPAVEGPMPEFLRGWFERMAERGETIARLRPVTAP